MTEHLASVTADSTSPDTQDPATLTDILLSSASASAFTDTPLATEYLNHLTDLPLPELLSEPPSLATHAHHLTSSLTNLTHASYPTFLALHSTNAALTTSLGALSTSLSTLLTSSLPALEISASKFKLRTEPVLNERTKARGVLEQHDKLRDLLDAPLLIDTCVRNGYFAEALSLAAHISSAVPPSASDEDLAIMRDVRLEVDQSIRAMLGILLGTLREPGRKLPALWKAANFVRRMGVLKEDELALAFLTGRGECLKRALETLARENFVSDIIGGGISGAEGVKESEREAEDVARYLRKYIDVWREGVYDIITQYTAIFLEERSLVPSTPVLSPSKSDPSSTLSGEQHVSLRALLASFASQVLTAHLLPKLATLLPRVPPAYPSLLTQLTYCATAFARVGMDFRGLLGGLFSTAVASGVASEMKGAGKDWTTKVQNAMVAGIGRGKPAGPMPPSQWLIAASLVSSPPTPSSSSATSSPVNMPPSILASYPPLAEFTNALLTTLNSLRLLAPISILRELLDVLDMVLAESSDAFLGYARSTVGLCSADEREREDRVVHAAGDVLVKVFIPFVRRALVEGVYGIKMAPIAVSDGGKKEGESTGYGVDRESELAKTVREWEGWLLEKSVDV